jgi:hypothetical protein
MIPERIWCSCCGHEGSREIMGTASGEFPEDVFISKGHDPYSGKMYFRCPHCKVVITVDPNDAFGSFTMNGYPIPSEVAKLTDAQNILMVCGVMYTGLTVLILFIQMFC